MDTKTITAAQALAALDENTDDLLAGRITDAEHGDRNTNLWKQIQRDGVCSPVAEEVLAVLRSRITVDPDHEPCRVCGRTIPVGYGAVCADCLRNVADASGLEPRVVVAARDAAVCRSRA